MQAARSQRQSVETSTPRTGSPRRARRAVFALMPRRSKRRQCTRLSRLRPLFCFSKFHKIRRKKAQALDRILLFHFPCARRWEVHGIEVLIKLTVKQFDIAAESCTGEPIVIFPFAIDAGVDVDVAAWSHRRLAAVSWSRELRSEVASELASLPPLVRVGVIIGL